MLAFEEGAKRLRTASNHYNSTVTALVGQQGLYGKVDRFNQLSAKVSKSMPHLEPAHMDFETERLSLIVEPIEENQHTEKLDLLQRPAFAEPHVESSDANDTLTIK